MYTETDPDFAAVNKVRTEPKMRIKGTISASSGGLVTHWEDRVQRQDERASSAEHTLIQLNLL